MDFKGKVKQVLPAVHSEYNGSPNCKRVIVLETEPNDKGFTDQYAVEMYKTGDNIKFVDTDFDVAEGDSVTCEIGGKVNEYNGKFYNSLRVFKINKEDNF